jgi:hypothetical protein
MLRSGAAFLSLVNEARFLGAMVTALGVVVLLTACGKPPTAPSEMPPPSSGIGIDGMYTLRFESTCAALPPELRSRTYTASIAGAIGALNVIVTLAGAEFWMHPTDGLLNRFTGWPAGNSIAFNVRWPPTPGLVCPCAPSSLGRWGIVERIDSTRYFEIIGDGSGLIGRSTIEGTLGAGVGFGDDLRDDSRHVGCGAGGHSLTFRFERR